MTSIEWLEEKIKLSLGNEFQYLVGFFTIAKEMHKQEVINTWDDIFDNIESEMDCVVPLKVVKYLEKHYMKPTPLQTDENGKPLTYWGGVDFTNKNANNIKSSSTASKKVIRIDDVNEMADEDIRQNEQQISDEEIYKASFTEPSFSWHEGFIEGAKWYREQLNLKK